MAVALRSLTLLHLILPVATTPHTITRFLLTSLPHLTDLSIDAGEEAPVIAGKRAPLQAALLRQASAAVPVPVPLELPRLSNMQVSFFDDATFKDLRAPALCNLHLSSNRGARVDLAAIRRTAPHLSSLEVFNVAAFVVPSGGTIEPFERCMHVGIGPCREPLPEDGFGRLLQLLPQLNTLRVEQLLTSCRFALNCILERLPPTAHLEQLLLKMQEPPTGYQEATDDEEKALVTRAVAAMPSLHTMILDGRSCVYDSMLMFAR